MPEQSTAVHLSCDDHEQIKSLLVGHRIVAAETGSFDAPSDWGSYFDRADARLTLDDGTQILVVSADDCCSHWAVEHLATVDNVITDVRLAEPDFDSGWESPEYERPYAIYVVAGAAEVNVLAVDGSPGNYPYYATGYRLAVIPAEVTR